MCSFALRKVCEDECVSPPPPPTPGSRRLRGTNGEFGAPIGPAPTILQQTKFTGCSEIQTNVGMRFAFKQLRQEKL
jgi:hypothetical protein